MPFHFTIPSPSGTVLDLDLDVGQTLFVLGANGAGKSSLMQRFFGAHQAKAQRISAHRQTWLSSGAITITGEQKRNLETSVRSHDNIPNSRWMEHYSAERTSVAIYNLVDAENVRARSIADAFDGGDMERATDVARKDAPIKTINEILRLSNIPISLSVRENDHVVASKLGGPLYSVAELSDGERNALLIAASVLTTKSGSLLIIDEPERHLHRAIVSPLLTQLFARRPDCAFVISTHEITLPLDNLGTRTLLVRACAYSGTSVASWDCDILAPDVEIDETAKREILGARRKLVFVEGTTNSLDTPLYSLVFPDVSIVPKSSCKDVEHAVAGIRDAASLHYLHVYGIIDNDRRSPQDVERLRNKGVYALQQFSIESIYYHPELQKRVAARQAKVTGDDDVARLADARVAALAAVSANIIHLARRVAEKTLRDAVLAKLPTKNDVVRGGRIEISLDVASVVQEERDRLQGAIDSGDLESIIERYPIRDSSALAEIAKRLGFQGHVQYESAVRKLLADDLDALAFTRALFGGLASELVAS